ncbi:hypothetical protein J4434_07320 [Candidatus Woesearchaeota archaeon]|nr:hypothetical protein [Candidatus Woesearchaeota archaeon]
MKTKKRAMKKGILNRFKTIKSIKNKKTISKQKIKIQHITKSKLNLNVYSLKETNPKPLIFSNQCSNNNLSSNNHSSDNDLSSNNHSSDNNLSSNNHSSNNNLSWLNTRMLAYLFFAIIVCLGTIYFPYLALLDTNLQNSITGMAIGIGNADGFSGKAISGIDNSKEITTENLQPSTASINPLLGNIVEGKEFTVEVIAYPSVNGFSSKNMQKQNNFYIRIYFDPNFVDYVLAQPLLNGYTIDIDKLSGELDISGNALDPFENVFIFEPNKFVEIKFLAKKQAPKTKLSVDKFNSQNSLGKSGSSADIITTYIPSELTILEKGMDNFIPDYIESTPTYTGSQYWSKMVPKEKKEIQDAWNKLTPTQKEKYKSCTPNCQGKQCGTDGCGGFCGQNGANSALEVKCSGDKQCINNMCICQPNCFGKTCGDDGCGGLCYAKICVKEEVPGKLWKEWYIYAIALIVLAILISLGVVFRKRIKQKFVGAGQVTQQFTKQEVAQNVKVPAKETKPEQLQQVQQAIKQQLSTPMPHAPPQLVNYINQQIAKGVPKDKIKESLDRVGWKEEIVENAFREIRK